VVLVTAVAVNQFSWRYQLPGLILLPPAGALGLAALAERLRSISTRDAPAAQEEETSLPGDVPEPPKTAVD
jgi:hypothetical protein